MDFFASCAPGIEELLASELGALKARSIEVDRALVRFSGEVVDALRACLWSRLATRVGAIVGEGSIHTKDELSALVRALPWEDSIPRGTGVDVFCEGSSALLSRSKATSDAILAAINERLLERLGALAPKEGAARIRVQALVSEADGASEVVLAIDLSGDALYRRGYEGMQRRDLPTLRSDLAAALLLEAGWPELVESAEGGTTTLAVAFSGGCSLISEAAAMALDIAPGLYRGTWGFRAWPLASPASWRALVRDAERRRERAKFKPLRFIATDVRHGWRARPQAALRALGLDLKPEVLEPSNLAKAELSVQDPALWVADLSWAQGEGALASAEAALAPFACAMGAGMPCALASSSADAHLLFGAPLDEIATASGRAHVELLSYGATGLEGTRVEVAGHEAFALSDDAQAFARLFTERYEARLAEAAAEDVSCYRIWEHDLPTMNLAIDLYEGARPTPGRWLVVSEFEAPSTVPAETSRRRLLDAVHIASEVTHVAPLDVFVKVRRHAKGGSQYRLAPGAPRSRTRPRRIAGAELPAGSALVEEGGLLFEVDLESHLDTGIFLDTRDVRALIREKAKQARGKKRFLNLFAYTGTATVYAADGGCRETTTVDLSSTYLGVAERNLTRNGFLRPPADDPDAKPPHHFVRADAMEWIARERKGRRRWDLIWCDPPTFSNSKAMGKSFDVQADHLDLIIGMARLLTRDGLGIFCCNLRTFKPDLERLARAGVALEDITAQTIPFDFPKDRPPHHCYLVRRA